MSDVQPVGNTDHTVQFVSDQPTENDRERQEFEEWKRTRAEATDFEPDQHGEFDDTPKPSAATGSRRVPTEASKSEAVADVPDVEENPQSYVWLANGEVLLANDEDLPTGAGHGNWHGYWEKDGNVHAVIGVYPKEVKKKESK